MSLHVMYIFGIWNILSIKKEKKQDLHYYGITSNHLLNLSKHYVSIEQQFL